ncbi:MAG: aspartate kinase [Nannocystaceae bacterium]|nr:aspartate kinase [Nannocystaceae bacterium]
MLVFQKYGGTSLGTLDRIRRCARRCLGVVASGNELVVVVSAMSGETNRLIALANALAEPAAELDGASSHKGPWVAPRKGGQAHNRELDQLVSTGENVSASLLAMAIHQAGGQAVSLAGHQLGMRTDDAFTHARITDIETSRIRSELAAGRIVVCAGFQGTSPGGDITTLGRGGSDTSAVALAASLRADVCEILTDVDGVFTTDPRVVSHARKIDRLCFEEMLELASVGAKVLQLRSVEVAARFGVPIHVRSSEHQGQGTMIVPEEESMESVVVSAVALDRNEGKVTVVDLPDVPGTVAGLFEALAEAGIVVDMIIQNAGHAGHTDVSFTVPESDLAEAEALLAARGDKVVTDPGICKVSLVGLGMRSHAGVASRMFRILATEGINIDMVTTSTIKISVAVAERYGELALRALHDGFGLAGPVEPSGDSAGDSAVGSAPDQA